MLNSVNVSAQGVPQQDTITINGKTFHIVENEAEFPGGHDVWVKFLIKNLNANVPADNASPVGKYTVVVKFAVGIDGNLTDVAAETNFGYGMEKEVLRLIQKSGKWNPAIKDGKPVKALRRQPVTFLVEEDGMEIYSKVPFTLFTNTNNLITVDIRKVKNSQITLAISNGSITANDDDQFIARVNKPGRVTITVYLKNNNKELGKASFEVRANNLP